MCVYVHAYIYPWIKFIFRYVWEIYCTCNCSNRRNGKELYHIIYGLHCLERFFRFDWTNGKRFWLCPIYNITMICTIKYYWNTFNVSWHYKVLNNNYNVIKLYIATLYKLFTHGVWGCFTEMKRHRGLSWCLYCTCRLRFSKANLRITLNVKLTLWIPYPS